MSAPGLYFAITFALFCVLFILVSLEQQRGRRLVLSLVRGRLDRTLEAVLAGWSRVLTYVRRYVLAWSWYLIVDVVLKSVLYVIVTLGERLEASFYHNRQRTKVLRAERARSRGSGVLAAVAAHKEQSTLSEAEKERRRTRSLEGTE